MAKKKKADQKLAIEQSVADLYTSNGYFKERLDFEEWLDVVEFGDLVIVRRATDSEPRPGEHL